MATMFPKAIPSGIPRSEKIIFKNLWRADHTSDWTVFHSHYVPVPGRMEREIDFVVIIPEYFCLICLEVKGGSYHIRKGGRWYAASSSTPLPASPQDQVKDSMFALRNHFEAKNYFGPGEPLSIGCAVVFTDADVPDPGLPPHLAESVWQADAKDPSKLRNKLIEIAEHTSHRRRPTLSKIKKGKATWPQRKNAQKCLADLQQELEPTDMSITSRIFSSGLKDLRERLLVLTNDQFNSLRLVKDNPCCAIDGAAGTGKTVLAMELARQHCEEKGERVALLCSNPYLSSRFVRWARTLSDDLGGTIVAGTHEDFSTIANQEQEKFNYLIVDEAQNLCDEESLNLMDTLLEGELTNGSWTMFGDFTYQQIVDPNLKKTGEEVLKRLQKKYPRMTIGRLEINCRNTYEIAAAVSMFVDIEVPPRAGVHGPLIQVEYFDSASPENLDNLLDYLVTDLKDREFLSRQIILLSSSSDDFNTTPEHEYGGWKLLNVQKATGETDLDKENVPNVSEDSFPKILRYSDIYNFQGLESEAVILVIPFTEKTEVIGGVATLPDYDYLQRVLYTGMSRAIAILIIVADKRYEEHLKLEPRFESTYTEFIEKLVLKP